MAENQEKYSLVKEMFIAFLGGGSLGLLLVVFAEIVVAWLKK